MKKFNFRFLIITLIATLTISFILPFNIIYGDSQTYIGLNTPYQSGYSFACVYYGTSSNSNWNIRNNDLNVETRTVILKGASKYYVYIVGLSSFVGNANSSISCNNGASGTSSTSKTYNSNNYYVVRSSQLSNSGVTFNNDVPVIQTDNYASYDYAYRYTFGDLSVGPAPPIQAGDLTFNYYTDFASSYQNTINQVKLNRDTITWDYDTNNSNINGLDLRIDLRAVPINYNSSSDSNLFSLTWSDLNIDASYYADLGSYPLYYNNSQVSFTWEEVVNKIQYISNLPDLYNDAVNFWNFKVLNYQNKYYWRGWIYQIRLNTVSGDYTGEWQTIYQVSSAPPDDSSTVINYYVNGTGVTEPIYQSIQNINNQNNITNNTWYVNGSPFNVDDNSATNWWEQLLQFIRDIVAEILGFLGSIFDTLVNAILELVNSLGIDFLGLISQIINGIVDFFNNLDLTGSNFVLPSSFNNLIQSLSGSTNGILNVWFNNGLGMFIMIPLIIWLIGVVL